MIVNRIRPLGIRSPFKGFGAVLFVFATTGMLAIAGSDTLAAARNKAVTDNRDGITLIGLFPPPDVTYDVPVLPPREGLDKIIKALQLIRRQSPLNAAGIETLKKNGPVTVIYEPRYPNPKIDLSTVRVAVFLPSLSKGGGPADGKKYYAVIGRHGIKWPEPDLAAILVHELVGHGMQHFRGRIEGTRNADLECEATLYQEKAHQDLGMDKFSAEMIKFQKQLAGLCMNFIAYLKKNDPERARLWEAASPDVPELLRAFERYLKSLFPER